MPFTLFPGSVPNVGALGTGGYAMSPAEQMRANLAAIEAWEQSTYGQRRAQQEQAANSRGYQLAEREYDLKRDGLKQTRARLAIEQCQAKADEWYKRASIDLSREELSFKVQQHKDTLEFDKQRHRDTMGLQGLQLGAELRRNPIDMFRSLWAESQTAGDPTMSGNIANWAQAFGGTQQPRIASTPYATGPATLDSLAASMTGQGGVGSQIPGAGTGGQGLTTYNSPGVQATLGALAQFGAAPHQAAPGFLETKSDTERQAIAGGLAETGYLADLTNTKYRRSRLPSSTVSASAA
jgi:hypothetical protein